MKTASNQFMKNLTKCLNKDLPFNQVGKIMVKSLQTKPSNKTTILSPKPKTTPKGTKINKNKA